MTSCQINILLYLYFSITYLISNILLFESIREAEKEVEQLRKIVVECCFKKN